jgi:putative nucleotidyltransferase with HDIG domain
MQLEEFKAHYELEEKRYRKTVQQLNQIFDQTINALAWAVQMRDPYTAAHQFRVALLACAIAETLNVDEEKSKGIRVTAILHDLGKINVPSEILSRPGKLNEVEFALIKEHPKVGYDILRRIDFPWAVAQAVLQHHERINGSGYPAGLCCKDILLEAKIIAVADVVESMASHRPYRSAVGLKEALDEIRKNAGILYDKDVADACLQVFASGSFSFAKESFNRA